MAATTSTGPQAFARSLLDRGRPQPSYPRLPAVDGAGRSNLPGVYLTGEVAGTPLIKLGLNMGHDVIEHIHAELGAAPADDDVLDVVIVGAGAVVLPE